MSSIKDRQRAAARARLEKEMSERAESAKKRRQRQAVIGSALGVVVIAGLVVWLVSNNSSDDDKTTSSAPPPGTVACSWTPEDSSGGATVKDVGLPPNNAKNTGTDTMTLDTTLGKIVATVDKSKAPCTAAAFEFLSSKKFWDGTKCHRLVTEGLKVLQCGDPNAKGAGYRETDGRGGPSFRYAEENLPTNVPAPDPSAAPGAAASPYPKGTIAMANTGEAGSSGSQFFICYDDVSLPATYTILGKVTSGLDIVQKVAAAGSDNSSGRPGDGHPKTEIGITALTMAAA